MEDLLDRAGWMINTSKGKEPTRSPNILGFICDFSSLSFYNIEKKMKKILELLETEIPKGRLHVKALAKVAGKLMACGQVIRLMLKSIYKAVDISPLWRLGSK